MSLRLVVTIGFVALFFLCYGVNAKLRGDDCEGKSVVNYIDLYRMQLGSVVFTTKFGHHLS